jgi:hypothetical protein
MDRAPEQYRGPHTASDLLSVVSSMHAPMREIVGSSARILALARVTLVVWGLECTGSWEIRHALAGEPSGREARVAVMPGDEPTGRTASRRLPVGLSSGLTSNHWNTALTRVVYWSAWLPAVLDAADDHPSLCCRGLTGFRRKRPAGSSKGHDWPRREAPRQRKGRDEQAMHPAGSRRACGILPEMPYPPAEPERPPAKQGPLHRSV